MLTELDKQAFQAAVTTANAGQKAEAYHQLLDLAQKNPDEVDLLLWVAFTAPGGRVANRVVRRAWSLKPQDPTVQMARQWLEMTYPLEAAEIPASLDLDSLTHSTESPPPPPFFAAQPPPPPPYSGPIPPYTQVPSVYPYAPPPFVPGAAYGTYSGLYRTPFPYEVMPKGALKDLNGGLVFLIFLAYLVGGGVIMQMLGSLRLYGMGIGFWPMYGIGLFPGIILAIGATIETSQRRARYGAGSSSNPVLVFCLVFLFSVFAFALYMADFHRFRFRREHGWYGPIYQR